MEFKMYIIVDSGP